MSRNLLAEETSPYLLQHRDNPVHWQPWGPEALDRARREDKPILLSVGYAACHWCHVMAHESFEDPAIAAVMNELFVNIKVDREERPDLDVIYQSALALMGEHGGWPLTMFLTPAGEPFWGGTYFPSTPRYGRPAFPDILKNVAAVYHGQADKVQENVTALKTALDQLSRPQGAGTLAVEQVNAAAALSYRTVDPVNGGMGGAPKFPQPPYFRALWRAHRRTGSDLYREAVTVTLDRMCQGGIYDHLGGGFARYSTDAEWLAPHFEKMLYDNALLIDLLTEVWHRTGSRLYAQRVRETVDWAMRDMAVEDGAGRFAFASAYDADSEGQEGKFYVWTEAEIDDLLGGASPVFKQAYDVSAGGNWEGHNILNRRRSPALGSDAHEDALARGRAALMAVRNGRVWPQRDDKVLTDWNALMIVGLARAGAGFDEPDWIAAAETVFDFVRTNMVEDGRLRHSWRGGRLRHPAVLDDYAFMSLAALALFDVTGKEDYLRQAGDWVQTANDRYWDHAGGGYFLSADDVTDVITRSKTVADNATPSANGIMVEVLARLYLATGDEAHRARADELVGVFAADEPRHLVGMPSLTTGFALLADAVQVVVAGDPDDAATAALLRAALDTGVQDKVILRAPPGRPLPAGHPAAGKGPVNGRPAAYVCRGATCGLPVTDPQVLRHELGGR
ncbi:MAG: thioredoxin domain-containing protein [Hyphomicrobiales bacterium]|nr:thioredoxin domain-containing protein [Hyphomicrobiales bacterium]MCP5370464.1 thioredoxin domain-containing protein [Hyphomicrobiales bacterium]